MTCLSPPFVCTLTFETTVDMYILVKQNFCAFETINKPNHNELLKMYLGVYKVSQQVHYLNTLNFFIYIYLSVPALLGNMAARSSTCKM